MAHTKVSSDEISWANTSKKRSAVFQWWMEVYSVLFSFACLAVTVAVLGTIDGKPYQTFRAGPVDITPNTFLSIVSTASKSSFLLPIAEGISQLKWTYFQQRSHRVSDLQTFDEASRGPLGSLKLIWIVGPRALVASAGAVLTLLALATDPFTQQILSYPSITAPATNLYPSSSPPAANLSAWIGTTYSLQTPMNDDLYDVKVQSLNKAMYTGALGSVDQVKYLCHSGDCSWPEFDTLGLCSHCEDVSRRTRFACNKTECQYHLPSGAVFHRKVTHFYNASVQEYLCTPAIQISTRVPSTHLLPWGESTAAHVSSLSLSDNCGNPFGLNSTSTLTGLAEAFECKITWCVKTYSSSKFRTGVLEDEPSFVSPLHIHNCRSSPIYESRCAGYKAMGTGRLADASAYSSVNRTYWLSKHDVYDLTKAFASAFSTETSNQNPFVDHLYYANGRNFSKTLADVVTSLTNRMRNFGSATMIPGTEYLTLTYVKVNWPWIIYPALLSVFAAIFLFVSIAFSLEGQKLVWKSSTLPLLFHGLQGWDSNELRTTEVEEMEKLSRDMLVHLSEDDGTGSVALRKVSMTNVKAEDEDWENLLKASRSFE